MKRLCCVVGISFALMVSQTSARAQEPAQVEVTLHAGQTGPAINPFLYGQFIEHLGRCIYGGIWAEMLEDRKFYFPVTSEYRPYRSLRDTAYPVVGASPWEKIGPAEGITMDEKDPFVGKHTPRLAAGSGIRHRDLGLVAGKAYTGYIWLNPQAEGARVEVRLVWGDEPGDGETVRLENLGADYRRYPFSFTSQGRTDKGMLEIRAEGQAVHVGTVSLMPGDNVRGMRADTLGLLKRLGGTMYRWPGGNFVSGYEWRDGIGDRDRRPPRKNPAWTGVEHNDFGLDEFLDFCREIDTELVIAVNTGMGDAYSAAQEVEYANGGPDTIGGSWRVKNGHTEPYAVKYWCVGNEMWGPWQLGFMQLKHYTFKHNQVAEAMWKVDPELQLIGSGQLGVRNTRHDPDEKRGWSEGLLAECADHMNLISEHFYRDVNPDLAKHVRMLAEEIKGKAEGERRVQDELGLVGPKRVPVAMDEWNYWHRNYVYGELGCKYDLADALGVAIGLHEYFRNTDIIEMAHYAQTVNVIGCIKTTRTEAFLDSTALPLLMYRHHYGRVPITLSRAGGEEAIDITAAWSEDRKSITVGLVNPTKEAQVVAVKLDGVEVGEEGLSWVVSGSDPGLTNEPGDAKMKVVERPVQFAGTLKLEPLSINIVRLAVK